jgi:hypothetical protein
MENAERFLPERDIFIQPRKTIREVIQKDPTLWALTLPILWGIDFILDKARANSFGDTISHSNVLTLAVVAGPIAGLVHVWLMSHLVRITGKWLGGGAARKEIRTAMAWSYAPQLIAVILWFFLLIFIGYELFTENTPRMSALPLLSGLHGVSATLQAICLVWTFVLASKTIAEVQGYESAWRGLGNLFLAGCFGVAIFGVLGVLFVVGRFFIL